MPSRPAETTTGVAGAIVAIIVWVTHIKDPNLIGALVVVIAALPAAITWLVITLRKNPNPSTTIGNPPTIKPK